MLADCSRWAAVGILAQYSGASQSRTAVGRAGSGAPKAGTDLHMEVDWDLGVSGHDDSDLMDADQVLQLCCGLALLPWYLRCRGRVLGKREALAG